MHKEFQTHRLNEEGMEKAKMIAYIFDECLDSIESLCPSGRELAIVRTKLEEACFFAKKAMASDSSNGEGA